MSRFLVVPPSRRVPAVPRPSASTSPWGAGSLVAHPTHTPTSLNHMRLPQTLASAAAAASVLLGGTAAAQTTFGSGCAGDSGVTPTLAVNGTVTSGQTWFLEVTSPGGIGLEYLLIGFSNTNSTLLGGLPLPFDLGLIFGDPAWTGCPLNVDADYTIIARNFNPGINGGVHQIGFPGFDSGSVFMQIINVDPNFLTFNPIAGVSGGIEIIGTFGAGAQPGDLVITEIMQNPAAVGDNLGEYFEVLNTTGADIDVEGWTLSDDGSNLHVIDNGGAGVIVPAGSYFVFGNNADFGTNGGVVVDYEYPAAYALANGDDEIVITDLAATEIARVNYDGGPVFPDPTGKSMELNVAFLNETDNDNGANWAESTCFLPNPSTDLGTPGIANDQCNTTPPGPGSGELIFTEIMANPAVVGDTYGEWFELYNTTGAAIDMNGYTLTQGSNSFVVTGSFVIPAGGYGVFLRDGNPANNGGLDPLSINAYDYVGNNFFLGNSGATLEIFDGSLNKLGSIAYDDVTFPTANGRSIILDPTVTQDLATSLVGANWCTSTSSYVGDGLDDGGLPVTGVTQFGTPVGANDTCPIVPSGAPTGELVVTEIMNNGIAETTDQQWFELFNATGAAIDIDGYILADTTGDYHVINNGGPLTVPAGGRVTLGASNVALDNGGITHDYAYNGVFLGGFTDSIVVATGAGAIVAQLDYDGNAGWPVANPGHSLILDPAVGITHANSVVAANWCKSYFTGYGTDANFGTPAGANDTCPIVPSGVATGELIITEFLADGASLADGEEFLEIFNTTGAAIDINGYILADADNDYHIIDNGGALLVPAGGYLTLGASNDTLVNGNTTHDYVYGKDLFISNGTDELILATAGGAIVCEIANDNGSSFPTNTAGLSAILDPAAAQTQAGSENGTNWCQSSSTYGDATNAGTPGAANDSCGGGVGDTANSGDIIVTEVMQNPAAVLDSAGEYFEIYNTTGSAIDVNGWTFTKAANGANFTVNQIGGLSIPAGGFLVFGVNGDSLTNGGVTVDYAYPSAYFLGNSSDSIIVSDVALTEICRVEWDNGATFPDPNGASMNLDAGSFNLAASLDGANWCPTSLTQIGGTGDFGTPGAANELCP
jgi:hypothetical protein